MIGKIMVTWFVFWILLFFSYLASPKANKWLQEKFTAPNTDLFFVILILIIPEFVLSVFLIWT